MDLKNTEFKKTRFGIWGLGVSGRAILSFLTQQGHTCSVLEQDLILEAEKTKPGETTTYFKDPEEREQFFASVDVIIPSPGIDLTTHNIKHKILTEIDLFASAWHKPLIALTGTLGKTSTTHLLSTLLSAQGKQVATGGNIGIGMLDLIALQDQSDYAVLELSSFQLDYARTVAPDLAIITNLYENHLDRHKTVEAYFEAKKQILLHQKTGQQALLPLELAPLIRADERLKNRSLNWFTAHPPSPEEWTLIAEQDSLFCTDSNGNIVAYPQIKPPMAPHHLLDAHAIPVLSFKENWITLAAACYLLGFSLQDLLEKIELSIPHNRLEFVATVNQVDYINDSKSTIIQATIAAINSIKTRPLILLLGGVSKGVDRAPFLKELRTVDLILCFGTESTALAAACLKFNIPALAFNTLEKAVEEAHRRATPGTSVLLSPGGASFDLFKNYEARGHRFAELVAQLSTNGKVT